MPVSNLLNFWISESGSWQSYIDFKLPEEERARYNFLSQYDNFYLSLMTRAIELLKSENIEELKNEYLITAKGLEIFSLPEKRDQFTGVNHSDNILFVASLYYLASYSASAWILSKIYPTNIYQKSIDQFITSFLRRDISGSNKLTLVLKRFLETGKLNLLRMLRVNVNRKIKESFNVDIDEYFSHLVAKAILKKFHDENIWSDLLKINADTDHWKDYVIRNIEKKVPVWSFFPSQKLAIQKGILDGTTYSLQMPTSSGKTSISELIIYDEYKKNSDCKILYLAPYRALASELKQSLAISLGELGITSKTIYGGNLPTVEEQISIRNVNLLISTPEKFMAIEDIFPEISHLFTTIICDEGHLLDDDSRGLSYELLLSRLKSSNDFPKRFIFISAIIPNISTVNKWLGGTEDSLISSDYRPTELEYAFLKKMERVNGYYLDINPHKEKPYNYQLYKYLFDDELKIPVHRKVAKKITSKKGISVAVSLKAANSGTVALFAPHKRGHSGVEGLAEEALIQISSKDKSLLTKYSPNGYLDILIEYFTILFGVEYLLTKCSKIGVLFHHGDFPQNVREVVEDSLRDNKIRFVICTNTLAEGVNLPIKTMVLHSTKRYDPSVIGRYSPLKIRDLKNLVGRAGRAGKETKGLVIIPHSEDFDIITNLIKEKNIEPVKGQLYNIIKIINNYFRKARLQISAEILDSLSEQLQELLDNIDISLIDLLAEETNPNELEEEVSELVKETLSYFQATASEKHILNTIFVFRANKLRPFIENGTFKILKNSGTNIRLFEEITKHFDFDNQIWLKEINILDKKWLDYILDDGIFQLSRFSINLQTFNHENNTDLKNNDIKKAIKLWMKGNWYPKICRELQIEMHQVLRLINSFLNFNVQSIIGSVIRLKELTSSDYELPTSIANWPAFLQHGVNSQLELDLIEMGLIDRIAVFEVSNYLIEISYQHHDYNVLKEFMLINGVEILQLLKTNIPIISYNKLQLFNNSLHLRNIL